VESPLNRLIRSSGSTLSEPSIEALADHDNSDHLSPEEKSHRALHDSFLCIVGENGHGRRLTLLSMLSSKMIAGVVDSQGLS
jgi:hypothetical protein